MRRTGFSALCCRIGSLAHAVRPALLSPGRPAGVPQPSDPAGVPQPSDPAGVPQPQPSGRSPYPKPSGRSRQPKPSPVFLSQPSSRSSSAQSSDRPSSSDPAGPTLSSVRPEDGCSARSWRVAEARRWARDRDVRQDRAGPPDRLRARHGRCWALDQIAAGFDDTDFRRGWSSRGVAQALTEVGLETPE
jgi:hypothetical protein